MKTSSRSLALFLAGLLAAAAGSPAATFTVTNTNNSGVGSLRQAILDANANPGADTILFDAALSGQTIPVSGLMAIGSGGLTISAAALAEGITLSGRDASRIFSVSNGSLDLTRIRLIRANNGNNDGGAINLDFSNLTLIDCAFEDNKAGSGAAIYSSISIGRVYASGCTFERNVAVDDAGAVWLGGSEDSIFSNCTFSANVAENKHGAMSVYRASVFLNHCTFFGNAGGVLGTGGIFFAQPITLNRCIVAGNTTDSLGTADLRRANSEVVTSVGGNLIGNNGGTLPGNVSDVFPAGSLVGTPASPLDARLRPLGPSGGPTWTHAPLPGSPAINAGGASPFATDQRGFPRDVGGSCDLGAVERGPLITVTNTADAGAGSLRAAIAAVTAPDTRIQFPAGLNGLTITLTTGPLDGAGKQFEIDASTLAGGITIAATPNTARHLNTVGGFVALNRILLRDGFALNGGSILTSSRAGLLAVDVTFTGNRSSGVGGTVAILRGSAAFHRCTLAGGSGSAGGGFYGEGPGRFLFSNSTVSGNAGGGLEVRVASGELDLLHCTVTANTGRAGVTSDFSASARLENCLVAGNTGATSPDLNRIAGTFFKAGANLVGNNGGAATGNVADVWPAGSIVGTPASPLDALLAPLDNYGGFFITRTHALRAGSPARNATFTSYLLRDQRGLPRIGQADLGAYEAGQANPSFLAYIWETLPPSATVADHGADADFDGDGSSNYQEYLTATDPTVATSFFRPTVRLADSLLLVAFPTVAGRSYTLESSLDLQTWTPQGTIFGDGQPTELFVSASGRPKIYARIRVAP